MGRRSGSAGAVLGGIVYLFKLASGQSQFARHLCIGVFTRLGPRWWLMPAFSFLRPIAPNKWVCVVLGSKKSHLTESFRNKHYNYWLWNDFVRSVLALAKIVHLTSMKASSLLHPVHGLSRVKCYIYSLLWSLKWVLIKIIGRSWMLPIGHSRPHSLNCYLLYQWSKVTKYTSNLFNL